MFRFAAEVPRSSQFVNLRALTPQPRYRISREAKVQAMSSSASQASQRPGAVVTGAGSGIGRALSIALVARGLHVLAVGRRRDTLFKTKELSKTDGNGILEELPADVSTEEGRQSIATRLGSLVEGGEIHLDHLVHNAATLGEVGALSQITPSGFQKAMATNVEGPIFLTQALVPLLKKSNSGARILHISSGAAHQPLEGWLTYCVSKAALLQSMKCLDQELAPAGIRVASMMPGVVDTPMQEELRSLDFPSVEYFRSLAVAAEANRNSGSAGKAPPSGSLDQPANVADFLAWLLLEVKADDFGGHEWDINDPKCQQSWLKARSRC
eukprot:TRINITY_DN11187_c0_g4_i1.p1 TRINITY_DN11187_c0_g4~~TRINITY_DN11187_c0_g4_i1.p1  ORF type:complete len:326 (+),score=56.69 TRINITY_DN11187_c0_g4_i1:55-1032(+)